mmetsp:Transcript_24201/g.82654  ORF Transcript_24201/g.82654 Transcript_24201/m.82654 type:complete len:658 (+) Transcript_24201:1224-3197(+)
MGAAYDGLVAGGTRGNDPPGELLERLAEDLAWPLDEVASWFQERWLQDQAIVSGEDDVRARKVAALEIGEGDDMRELMRLAAAAEGKTERQLYESMLDKRTPAEFEGDWDNKEDVSLWRSSVMFERLMVFELLKLNGEKGIHEKLYADVFLDPEEQREAALKDAAKEREEREKLRREIMSGEYGIKQQLRKAKKKKARAQKPKRMPHVYKGDVGVSEDWVHDLLRVEGVAEGRLPPIPELRPEYDKAIEEELTRETEEQKEERRETDGMFGPGRSMVLLDTLEVPLDHPDSGFDPAEWWMDGGPGVFPNSEVPEFLRREGSVLKRLQEDPDAPWPAFDMEKYDRTAKAPWKVPTGEGLEDPFLKPELHPVDDVDLYAVGPDGAPPAPQRRRMDELRVGDVLEGEVKVHSLYHGATVDVGYQWDALVHAKEEDWAALRGKVPIGSTVRLKVRRMNSPFHRFRFPLECDFADEELASLVTSEPPVYPPIHFYEGVDDYERVMKEVGRPWPPKPEDHAHVKADSMYDAAPEGGDDDDEYDIEAMRAASQPAVPKSALTDDVAELEEYVAMRADEDPAAADELYAARQRRRERRAARDPDADDDEYNEDDDPFANAGRTAYDDDDQPGGDDGEERLSAPDDLAGLSGGYDRKMDEDEPFDV